MLKVKFFISAKKRDEANILIRFSNGRKFDFTAQSGKQIKVKFWNNAKGIVKDMAEFADRENFQEKLNDLEIHIKSEYGKCPDKSKIDKKWLDLTIDRFNSPDQYLDTTKLFDYIQNFINNAKTRINPKTGNPVSYKMRREYDVTYAYLKEFAVEKKKEYNFSDIDLEFYQEFTSFLRDKGLAVNTIGKKIQTLKIFLNDATEQGINKTLKYKSKMFKTLKEESDNIFLNQDELKQLYEYDFSNNTRLERVRDVFIIGCWTGLRFSDLEQVTTDKINNDKITLRQKKTGDKVVIPVHYTVKEILQKYDNNLPAPISNQKFNEYIKEAAELAGLKETFIKTTSKKGLKVEKKYFKHEVVCSHTARRSFCTNLYEMGIPTLSIMALSGHKSESAFLKYIKTSPDKHADIVMKFYNENTNHLKIAK